MYFEKWTKIFERCIHRDSHSVSVYDITSSNAYLKYGNFTAMLRRLYIAINKPLFLLQWGDAL